MLLDRLARPEPVARPVRVQGAVWADGGFASQFDLFAALWPTAVLPAPTRLASITAAPPPRDARMGG